MPVRLGSAAPRTDNPPAPRAHDLGYPCTPLRKPTTFAEFEVDLLRLRTREGMAIARAKGRLRGKQPKLTTAQQTHLVKLHGAGEHSIADLAELFSVSRPTVYRGAGARQVSSSAGPSSTPGSRRGLSRRVDGLAAVADTRAVDAMRCWHTPTSETLVEGPAVTATVLDFPIRTAGGEPVTGAHLYYLLDAAGVIRRMYENRDFASEDDVFGTTHRVVGDALVSYHSVIRAVPWAVDENGEVPHSDREAVELCGLTEVSAQAVFGADPAGVVQSALAAHRSRQRQRWEEEQRPIRQLPRIRLRRRPGRARPARGGGVASRGRPGDAGQGRALLPAERAQGALRRPPRRVPRRPRRRAMVVLGPRRVTPAMVITTHHTLRSSRWKGPTFEELC
jgi:hypothetical protein